MSSICLLLPFFCQKKLFSFAKPKFPAYFDYFIETFSKNKDVHLKIFTNLPYEHYQIKSDCVTFYSLSFNSFIALSQKKLNLKLKNFYPYKICDLKPSFGLIFEDYLPEYDYWGYCDADMIIGNLSKFFTDENLASYEVVTTGGIPGYMIVYRNNEKMKFLFQKSPDYLKVYEDSQNWRFDECGKNGIIALEQIIAQENIKVNHLKNLVNNDCGGWNRNRKWEYIWNNGLLLDSLTQEEIGSVHLIKCKGKKDFVMESLRKNVPIKINATGIYMI